MSRRKALLTLAARVEAAQGADRYLDRRIDYIRWPVPQPAYQLELSLPDHWDVPAFTASLDAAASLVPADWGWSVNSDCWALLAGAHKPSVGSQANKPSCALTAAALRVLAEEAGDE